MRKVHSIIWYENQRDQKEHADTEGEVQMGTARADGC